MDLWSGQTEEQKHAWYAFQQGMGKSAKEIRIFGLAGYLRERHWDNITAAFEPYWRKRRKHALKNLAVMGGRVLVTAGALAYTGWQAGRGHLDLTGLATALPLILTIGQADTWMFGMIGRGSAVLSWLEDLAIADPSRGIPVARTQPRTKPENAIKAGDFPPTITFDDVSFTYPRSEHPILDGLTMQLPAGEAAALVGVNGAGKSTLVKLLAGTYRPSRGHIFADDIDLATLDEDARAQWQRRVAPITQDFVRLPLCAGDNVELGTGHPWAGRVDLDTWPGAADLDPTVLAETARRAGITDLIERLSDGWKTPLDKTIPGGTDLSGGEWQRIGLARALRAVSVGADVLVLDEPAAALDVEAEARLVDGYLDLAQHVTSLVISHRFSVVRPVPLIYVLEHGRIVEQGSHLELMAAAGRYHTMFSLQASRYVEAVHAAHHADAGMAGMAGMEVEL
jgi:ATP-binding cassette subfamily B protein